MKKRRWFRLLEPGYRSLFLFLALFAAGTGAVNLYLGIGEAALVVLLYVIYYRLKRRRRRIVMGYLDQLTYHSDTAVSGGLMHFPLPMVVLRMDTSEILWGNDLFYQMIGRQERLFEMRAGDVLPGLELRFLLEGKSRSAQEVCVRRRYYAVFGSAVRESGPRGRGLAAALYFVETTETVVLRREYSASRPVCALMVIDNYEEVMKNCNDSQKSGMLAALDDRVSEWTRPCEGILRKYDRDRYLFLFEQRHLPQLVNDKFALLDRAREIQSPSGLAVTLSIGVGTDAETPGEAFSFASLSIDMSMSRGGDQAVIKNRHAFEFYGGRTKALEKRTKVKPRVMANTLARLISDSSNVIIMGHQNADLDAVGAAVGVATAVRKRGRKPYIVIDENRNVAQPLLARMRGLPEYQGVFIDPQTALILSGPDTLLVVVDVSRPDIVQSEELLEACQRVAVIDHHRRGVNYLEHVALSFHEPYASSACELVCELLPYILDTGDLGRLEAEALLSGIVLDTKNFTMHTGVGTFEAAAFLRSAGADMIDIKRMFQNDLKSSVARYDIVREAKMYREQIAIAAVDRPIARTTAAQAADELLSIAGVDASVVLFSDGGEVVLSARSLGKINVQMIMELLGGGGHQTIAGAQVQGQSLGLVLTKLYGAIDQYLEKNG